MKNKKSGKSVSKVKGEKEKRWRIFSKENLKWGLGGVVVLTVVSLIALNNGCPSTFPLASYCFSTTLFFILNIVGLLFVGLILFILNINFNTVSYPFLISSIILSLPAYYFLGILLKTIFHKIKR